MDGERDARAALERYQLHGVRETGTELGRGSFAAVVEVDYKGMRCAGKKIHHILSQPGEGDRLVGRFEEECRLLGALRHPHVVQFLGIFFDRETDLPVLVMEFLPITLAQCLDRYGLLPEEVNYTILRDVALGLRYLHEQRPPIIHRDLSANNVLLTSDMTAKISDLGVAKILRLSPAQMSRMTRAPGTGSYMPPEALRPDPRYDVTCTVDIFSFGVMVVHVLSSQWPLPSEATQVDPHNPTRVIELSEAERRAEYLDTIGRGHPLMQLIGRCLSNSPNLRPSASDLVERMREATAQHPLTFSNRVEMMRRITSNEREKEELQTRVGELEREMAGLRAGNEQQEKQLPMQFKGKMAINLKKATSKSPPSWTLHHEKPSLNKTQHSARVMYTSPICTAPIATTLHPPEYITRRTPERSPPSPNSFFSHDGEESDSSSSSDAEEVDSSMKYVAVLLKPKIISCEPWTAYLCVCLCFSGDHVKAVKELIAEMCDTDYEVCSQPLQFDDHLRLEVAEEDARRQGYKITPLNDTELKKEDIDRNYPYSEQPGGQSVKVDDVYPHKIPLQIQSIIDHPEPLDCALELHGQKDGEDFTLKFRLCNPRKAAQLTPPKRDPNGDILDSVPKMITLLNEVGARSTKWEAVGCELGLDECVICRIQADVQETQARFQRVFQEWKKMTPNRSWRMVIDALNAKQVGEHKLAYDLKSKLLENDII